MFLDVQLRSLRCRPFADDSLFSGPNVARRIAQGLESLKTLLADNLIESFFSATTYALLVGIRSALRLPKRRSRL